METQTFKPYTLSIDKCFQLTNNGWIILDNKKDNKYLLNYCGGCDYIHICPTKNTIGCIWSDGMNMYEIKLIRNEFDCEVLFPAIF